MATIMDTVVQYLNENGVGTETHPDGTLEVHTPPEADQLFIHIKKSGPFNYTATTWMGETWNNQPFWTEVGNGSWQQVHDELIVICAGLIEDWETIVDIKGPVRLPQLPSDKYAINTLQDKVGV